MAPPVARAPGAPSDAAVSLTRASAEAGAVTASQRYIWQLPRNSESASNDFPIVPTRHDNYDDVANIKSQFADGTVVGTNWVVPFTQEDASYEMRKRDDQENALFDQWVMHKYDITDPAQNHMLQNIAPELFKRREEVIDSQQALVSHYAKLRLRGARTLDDLRLQWLIETGRLTLPKGRIWDPKHWRDAQLDNQLGVASPAAHAAEDRARNEHRYKFGLFSPMRWVTTVGNAPNPDNPADIVGRGAIVQPMIRAPEPSWGNVYGGSPVMYPYTPGNLPAGPVAGEAHYGAGGGIVPNPGIGEMANPMTAADRGAARTTNRQHVQFQTAPRAWMQQ